MNSVIKRQSAHCMDVDEWKWLDKKLTTHYLKQVESQMEMSSRFVYQVVKVTKVGDVVTGATMEKSQIRGSVCRPKMHFQL